LLNPRDEFLLAQLADIVGEQRAVGVAQRLHAPRGFKRSDQGRLGQASPRGEVLKGLALIWPISKNEV
jgi:hypothetical protein